MSPKQIRKIKIHNPVKTKGKTHNDNNKSNNISNNPEHYENTYNISNNHKIIINTNIKTDMKQSTLKNLWLGTKTLAIN